MAYSKSDTCSKLIDPLIKKSGWFESNIAREYYFTINKEGMVQIIICHLLSL
jgi:type I site-specific restriction endonuclease